MKNEKLCKLKLSNLEKLFSYVIFKVFVSSFETILLQAFTWFNVTTACYSNKISYAIVYATVGEEKPTAKSLVTKILTKNLVSKKNMRKRPNSKSLMLVNTVMKRPVAEHIRLKVIMAQRSGLGNAMAKVRRRKVCRLKTWFWKLYLQKSTSEKVWVQKYYLKNIRPNIRE